MTTVYTEEQLEAMSNSELTALWNKLTGGTLKKFDSKAKGVDRIWDYYDKNGLYDEQDPLLDDRDEEPEVPTEKSETKKDKPKAGKGGDSPKQKKTRGRATRILEHLRTHEATVAELTEKFDTAYKNITGDLFMLRHGLTPGMKNDEVLVTRREGRATYYSVDVQNEEAN